MKTRLHVEGLRELDKALGELPKSTGKAVLRRVLKKAGEPIAADMRAMAPDAPGSSPKRDLRSSIGVSTKLSKRQRKAHRKAFRDDKAAAEMFVGAGPLPHPHLQEFGTFKEAPQPFARPAWDANKSKALEIIKVALADEITKAATRIARKQAKAAAKG